MEEETRETLIIMAPWDLQRGLTRAGPFTTARSKVRSGMWTMPVTPGRCRRVTARVPPVSRLGSQSQKAIRMVSDLCNSLEEKCDFYCLCFYCHTIIVFLLDIHKVNILLTYS